MKAIKNKNFFIYKSYLVNLCITIIIAYICVYLLFVKPIYKLHELQTKEWISNLTEIMIKGVNNKKLFNEINVNGDNISFWYCYWFFETKKYTIWVLFNLTNKNSSDTNINMYSYNHTTGNVISEKITVNFDDIKTYNLKDDLIIDCDGKYKQYINFKKNITTLKVNIKGNKLEITSSIADYITNQASFIPRYRLLNHVIDMNGKATHTPGEWSSDNPFNGYIINGSYNGDIIEANGSYWFDNFIGCNNYYLEPYVWFVIMNDDWMIYLLWFGEYEERNKPCTVKPILIKHRKTNKYIYSGCPGSECSKSLSIVKNVNLLLSPIKINTYETVCNIGDDIYDKHHIKFVTNEIDIKISAIEGSFTKVFDYFYYRTKNNDKENTNNLWEQNYMTVLNNIKYVEYIGEVNVEIMYENVFTKFKARQIIDSMYRNDKTIPYIIKYN